MHTIDAQEPGTECTGKIPTDALALSLNVTALRATPTDVPHHLARRRTTRHLSLNPAPGQPPTPNAVTTKLSVDQEFEIYNNRGPIQLVIDVNGYYANDNHDDRYPRTLAFTSSEDLVTMNEIDIPYDLPSEGILLIDGSAWSVPLADPRCNIQHRSGDDTTFVTPTAWDRTGGTWSSLSRPDRFGWRRPKR